MSNATLHPLSGYPHAHVALPAPSNARRRPPPIHLLGMASRPRSPISSSRRHRTPSSHRFSVLAPALPARSSICSTPPVLRTLAARCEGDPWACALWWFGVHNYALDSASCVSTTRVRLRSSPSWYRDADTIFTVAGRKPASGCNV